MKFDMHTHTKYSRCSLIKPGMNIKVAIKRGLDGIAVTDHNSIKGAVRTAKLAKKYAGFDVVVGEEIMTDIGEVIGYDLNSDIKPGSVDEVLDRIKEQCGISCIAHPFSTGIIRKRPDISSKVLKRVDCVEAFNARTSSGANKQAAILAARNGLGKTGGSDGHFLAEIGNGYTIFSNDLRKEILQKKTRVGGTNSMFWWWRTATFPVRIIRKI